MFVSSDAMMQGHRRDPALESAPGTFGERRRHARAYASWAAARAGDRYPTLPYGLAVEPPVGDTSVALFALTAEGGDLREVRPRLAGEGEWLDPMLAQVAARLPALVAQRAPLGFEAEVRVGATLRQIRGILLPFADEHGVLAFAQAVFSWKMAADLDAGMAAASRSAVIVAERGEPIRWPARPAIGTRDDRIGVARTWAKLAQIDPVRKAASVQSALSAIFDAMLAANRSESRALIDSVFENGWSMQERETFARMLDQASRLGMGAGMLGALLAHHRDGMDGVADVPAAPAAIAGVAVDFRLVAVEPEVAGLTPRRAAPLAEDTPWGRVAGSVA